jgi:superfamily II DNA or RNA helicase
MVQGIDCSYSGTELLAVGEYALANYNAWIVKQFVRYFRRSDTTGKAVLECGAGIGTLSVVFEREVRASRW